VKVFNAATGALLWSRELTDLTPGLNIFAINRDELQQLVNSDSGRIQFWIEVVIVTRQTRQGPASVNVFAPRFEVFDNQNGRTTINGGIWKTTNFLTPGPAGTTPIVFTGLE
jgi:hypothetical protein